MEVGQNSELPFFSGFPGNLMQPLDFSIDKCY